MRNPDGEIVATSGRSGATLPGSGPARSAEATHVGILRLLAELAERGGGDGVTQKRALLTGLARLINADAWTWTLTRTPRPGDRESMPVILLRLDGGMTDAQRDVLLQAQRSPHRSIFVDALFHRVHMNGQATCRRDELLSDEAWRASPYYAEFIVPLGFDEFAIGVRRIGTTLADSGGDVSTAFFYRAAGRPRFDDAANDAMDLVMDHVHWLHRHGPIDALAGPAMDLTPRERQVLQLLIAGEGRKQIAAKLRIGEHTVGDYQKRIYRRFEVGSRGELQAKFFDGQAQR